MKDEFKATFVVEVAPDDVWPALARKTADHDESAIDSPPGTQVWLPGWEMTGQVLEVSPGKRLRLLKDAQPCKGTEILIELEHESSGTRVTIVQSGFGAFFEIALKGLSLGWDHIVLDLALYLETGVVAHRHFNAWTRGGLGADTIETASGLRVTKVQPDTFASRVGLEPGDRLVTLAGATLGSFRDLVVALRTQSDATNVELVWVRGREKLKGTGSFSLETGKEQKS